MSSALEKLRNLARVAENDSPLPEEEAPALAGAADLEAPEEDNAVYGCDRTRRQKNMLSFRKADRTKRHIPYNQILMVDETDDVLLHVYTAYCVIIIEGRKLDLIGQRIKHGSLSYIQEGSKDKPIIAPDGACVYSITYESLRDSEQ